MTDPFSIIVGVTSLVALAAQTINVTHTYVQDARHGKESAEHFLQELNVLHFNLSRLDLLIKSNIETARQFDDTSVLVSSTHACRNRLNALHERLSKGQQERKFSIRTLKWPFEVNEHREAIGELRAFAQWIQFALSTDGCALLSKTSAEVIKIFKTQLESFQLLQKMNQQTVSMMQTSEESNQILKESCAHAERESILEWITTLDHRQHHYHVCRDRVVGTGQWFLDDSNFIDWREASSSSVLWCHGMQGSGKSILASLAIDHLRDSCVNSKVALAYFYFNYQTSDSLSAESVLRSLLKQLSMSLPNIPQPVREMRQRTESRERPLQLEDLEQAMISACEDFDHTFVVIDALDECKNDQRRALLRALSNLEKKASLRLLLTSRPHLQDEIKKGFVKHIPIEIGATDSDLAIYLSKMIEESDKTDEIDDKFETEIIDKIIEKARRMFLLAKLQIKSILDMTTAGHMEEALERMPRGLDEAFGDTLQRITERPDGQDTLGLNTLMWLTYARRPILVAELSEALAIKLGSTSLNSRFRPSQKRMVDCCMGLAVVDDKSSVIRLVHYSVQEYLSSHQIRVFDQAERAIAQSCITYLLFEPFGQGPREREVQIQILIAENVFASYAARHWGDHVRAAANEDVDLLAVKFLRAAPQRGCSNQIVHYARNYREEYWKAEEANSINGLHLAAMFGLVKIGRQLLEAGEVGLDDLTHMGTTALIKAAAAGHKDVVKLLMNKGANFKQENWYGTALHCAAEAGTVATIFELVANGVDVDIRDRRGRTSLHCATVSGHRDAIKVLLDSGADVNTVCHKNYTALRYAIVWEQAPEIVQILLENNADTTIRSNYGSTPLHDAAVLNSEDTLLLLLKHNADVEAREAHGGTPLHFAAERNHVAVVRHLLDHGADIHSKTTDGVSAIYLASGNGGTETVRALIDAGADVEAADNEGLTPLAVAVRENHEAVVPLLLDAGADVAVKDEEGHSLFYEATREGYQAVARMLQAAGARTSTIDPSQPHTNSVETDMVQHGIEAALDRTHLREDDKNLGSVNEGSKRFQEPVKREGNTHDQSVGHPARAIGLSSMNQSGKMEYRPKRKPSFEDEFFGDSFNFKKLHAELYDGDPILHTESEELAQKEGLEEEPKQIVPEMLMGTGGQREVITWSTANPNADSPSNDIICTPRDHECVQCERSASQYSHNNHGDPSITVPQNLPRAASILSGGDRGPRNPRCTSCRARRLKCEPGISKCTRCEISGSDCHYYEKRVKGSIMRRMRPEKAWEEPRAIECPDCSKTFQRSCDLMKHAETHNRPYKDSISIHDTSRLHVRSDLNDITQTLDILGETKAPKLSDLLAQRLKLQGDEKLKNLIMKVAENGDREASGSESTSVDLSHPAPSIVPMDPLKDYETQLLLLEAQNKKRVEMARQEFPSPVRDVQAAPASIKPLAPDAGCMVFTCQDTACSYTDKDEDRYKQHMENVHGWVHVRYRPLNDLVVPGFQHEGAKPTPGSLSSSGNNLNSNLS